MRLSFIHSSADLGNRLDQTGKVRCSTGTVAYELCPAELPATGRLGNCGADSGRRVPSCVVAESCTPTAGGGTEGSAQSRRQTDIMVKRAPSVVLRANSRVVQYRYTRTASQTRLRCKFRRVRFTCGALTCPSGGAPYVTFNSIQFMQFNLLQLDPVATQGMIRLAPKLTQL
jgi:hypothetical protein